MTFEMTRIYCCPCLSLSLPHFPNYLFVFNHLHVVNGWRRLRCCCPPTAICYWSSNLLLILHCKLQPLQQSWQSMCVPLSTQGTTVPVQLNLTHGILHQNHWAMLTWPLLWALLCACDLRAQWAGQGEQQAQKGEAVTPHQTQARSFPRVSVALPWSPPCQTKPKHEPPTWPLPLEKLEMQFLC